MSDFTRYLPFSNRGRGDETAVASDRREALADLVTQAATALQAADLGASRTSQLAESFANAARLRAEFAASPGDEALSRLFALAAEVRGGPRRSIRALADGARAMLLLARDAGLEAELPPMTAGAVSLYAVTTAPFDRRAVVKGRTVRASDADWAFGSGPVLTGTSTSIAAFLLGVSDHPPQPGVAPA